MCGICGVYNFNKDALVTLDLIDKMNQVIYHRGPDDSGIYIDNFLGFGHRRLSIMDIKHGMQPMCNEDESIWVTYNGEIYNFTEIKQELEMRGHRFLTNCDTEVIVHGYEEYGPDCVARFNGMFAFAVWDKKNETLFLARDRLGVKPLYYSLCKGNFIFGSEIKSILNHPAVVAQVETSSVPEYLFCTALLQGKTMFKDIYSLPAGNTLTFKNSHLRLAQYWDINLDKHENENIPFSRCMEDTLAMLDESVKLRLMSDVPFGSLLSGGLDSSLVSALATRHVPGKLKTFAMEYSKNDAVSRLNSDLGYARQMAGVFATDHKEFVFEPQDYQGILEKAIWHVEKPVELTTPSLYLLFKELKKDVTVVLSGEGADELFGGYFFFLNQGQPDTITEFPWAPYYKDVSRLLEPSVNLDTGFAENVQTTLFDMLNRFNTRDYLNKILYLFIKLYLLEMLERQDKTSMASGVEARVPFLDYRLVEFVANIPSRYKMHNGIEKYVLKELGRKILPAEIIDRKKKPFPFPIDAKSILNQKNIANELVQSGSSRISSYFNKKQTNDFFHKKNEFASIDNLAIFRTSHSLIALESWHKVFGV